MERIRQAVEQASRDRNDQAGAAVSPRRHAGRNPAIPAVADNIQYSETRTVEVSLATREKNRLVAAIPGHPMQDIYRMLRTRVLQKMKENNWATLGVTSPATGSGKTLTAINLAISIARDLSHTALLFDADLRYPSVYKYFGYTPEYGLNDYLFNDVPLNKILFHPNMDRLTVLPGREPIYESAEILSSPKLLSLLQEMRSNYADRLIIADIAPVLSIDDALALAPHIDCMLIVVESGATKGADLHRTMELMQGIPIIGTVLNKVDTKVIKAY